MKFKIDENLPIELADLLQSEGYDASTIYSESLKGAKDPIVIAVCQEEQRVLVTLDLDFADIQTYPPQSYAGIIVLRVYRQDKPYLLSFFQKLIPAISQHPLKGHLWIAEEGKIRIRE
jgi:predicted nuclease of predicted toxin-antitoxin system